MECLAIYDSFSAPMAGCTDLPRHIAEKASHPSDLKRNQGEIVIGRVTEIFWIGAILYSIFLPFHTGTFLVLYRTGCLRYRLDNTFFGYGDGYPHSGRQAVYRRHLSIFTAPYVFFHDINLFRGQYRNRLLGVLSYHSDHLFPAIVPDDAGRNLLQFKIRPGL
jgi:hypothetical protein